MAWGTANECAASSSTGSAALSVAVGATGALAPVGSVFVLAYANNGAAPATPTDSKSNTWSQPVENHAGGGFTGIAIAWMRLTTPFVAADTVNDATSLAYGWWLGWFAPPGTATIDKSASGSGSAASTTWATSATAALSGVDDLVVGAIGISGLGATYTPDVVSPTWTSVPTNTISNPTWSRTLRVDYRNVTDGSAQTYSGTISSASGYSAGVLAIQSSGPPPAMLRPFNPIPLMGGH